MAYDLFHVFKRLGVVPTNVILVGAWEGGEVKDFLNEGVKKVFLFEAEPSAIDILKHTYGKDPRVRIFEGAVAAESGQLKKFHVLNHGSSSLFMPNLGELKKILPDFQVEEEISVLTITLDSALREELGIWNHGRLNSLMILDIQGGELEALKGASKLLEKVDWIEAEVSTIELYQGQNTLKQLDAFLEVKGFSRVSTRIYSTRHHGDALYFRKKLLSWPFRFAMVVEDMHWNLARKKPSWLPSLRASRLGRSILKFIYGG